MAKVTETVVHAGARGTGHDAVVYEFKDREGRWRKGTFHLALEKGRVLLNTDLEVIYLPGDPTRSVPVDRRNWLAPIIFAALLVAFGYTLLSAWRAVPEKRSGPKGPPLARNHA